MNAFEALADAQQNVHSKARDRAAERRLAKLVVQSDRDAPMVASPMEKAAYEKQQLLGLFNKQMTARRASLLKGEWAAEIKGLLTILDTLAENSAPALMSYLAKCGWFHQCEYGTRFDILWLIDTMIVRYRVRSGLSPFDDGLPGEPPTAFVTIRREMTGV